MVTTERDLSGALRELVDLRWSCRAFRPEQVPRETVEAMLRTAQQAPSWCNTQPWRVIVTAGEATERFRVALSAHAGATRPSPDVEFPAGYEGVAAERRRDTARLLYEAVGVEWGDRAASAVQTHRNFELFDAPHVAVITTESSQRTYGAVDCGVYLGHLLLAASSLGLATVAQAAIAGYSPFVRDHFEIPEGQHVLAGVSFGFPDLEHPANGFRTKRAGLQETVRWED